VCGELVVCWWVEVNVVGLRAVFLKEGPSLDPALLSLLLSHCETWTCTVLDHRRDTNA
jgi:hypothetical protein